MIGDRDREHLAHMLQHAKAAVEFLGKRDAAALEAERPVLFGVFHALQIVGEAATRIAPSTRSELHLIPWGKVMGMRHHLVHGYDDIRTEIIVETIRDDLPALIAVLQSAIGDETP